MQDKVILKAPAKVNLFLHILDKKKDGYHIIRTGMTFLNLYDLIDIRISNKSSLSYSGMFQPSSKVFDNDIILKILKNINIKKNLEIKIKKNIPWKAGLGSASTDAAFLIKGLKKLGLIKKIDNYFLSKFGADVLACYHARNCLVTGIGDKININIKFPRYYFVIVYPNIQISTADMYNKIGKYMIFDKNYKNKKFNIKNLLVNNYINDFEKIIQKENKEIFNLLIFLSNLSNNSFSRMSGSGSCCYVVFKSKEDAKKAYEITLKKYSNFQVFLAENNINNNN